MNGEHVLVGLGYDDDGRPELDWAAREAGTRAVPLHVVRAYDPSEVAEPWIPSTDRMLTEDMRAMADEAVDAALAHVRQNWPGVKVVGRVVADDPGQALVEASAAATVTVLGGRQLTVLGAAVLGSVSAVVAARGFGPVVVVGQRAQEPAERSAVVVGVDGSAATEDALAFAFDHAARYGRPVHAIHCHQRLTPEPERAEEWLSDLVAGWRAKYPDLDLTTSVVGGRPVDRLVAAAAGSELLVVGPHAHRRRLPALLGSVSQGVLHHARCPVAVVHRREALR